MYTINSLSLQLVQSLFIQADRFRTSQALVGTKDGFNQVYLLPGGEKFIQNLPYFTLHLYMNGQRLELIEDFLIFESGGAGTGYDTVITTIPPKMGDKLIADYIAV